MSLFVVLFFDEEGDQTVRDIWQTLADDNVSDSMISKGIAPHLTLGMIPYEKQHNFRNALEAFAKRLSLTPVNIPHFGFFTAPSTILFLGVTMTDALYTLHRQFYKELHEYIDLESYYIPDQWIPHVTLADGFKPEELSQSLRICQQVRLPINIYANRIALVESDPINIIVDYAIQ